MLNLLISCDQNYYDAWGINCLKSIKKFSPQIKLHANIVNPTDVIKIPEVEYYYDTQSFMSDDHKISYLQNSRFIKCGEIFSKNEPALTIDCDTVCWRTIPYDVWEKLSSKIYVLKHHKKPRWLAGLVSYGKENSFRQELRQRLLDFPTNKLRPGVDQKVLSKLNETYQYQETLVGEIMSFSKGRAPLVTFKGEQKDDEDTMVRYRHLLKRLEL